MTMPGFGTNPESHPASRAPSAWPKPRVAQVVVEAPGRAKKVGDLDRADVGGLRQDLGHRDRLGGVELGVVEPRAADVDLVGNGEARVRLDQAFLQCAGDGGELHDRTGLIFGLRGRGSVRPGPTSPWERCRLAMARIPPVRVSMTTATPLRRLGGADLGRQDVRHLVLQGLVERQDEAVALLGWMDVPRRRRQARPAYAERPAARFPVCPTTGRGTAPRGLRRRGRSARWRTATRRGCRPA